MIRIVERVGEGVAKYGHGFLKRDAMLRQILSGFVFVPLKPHYLISIGTPSQMLAQEGDDLPAVYVFPGRLAERVVAAAQPDGVERVSGIAHAFDGVA